MCQSEVNHKLSQPYVEYKTKMFSCAFNYRRILLFNLSRNGLLVTKVCKSRVITKCFTFSSNYLEFQIIMYIQYYKFWFLFSTFEWSDNLTRPVNIIKLVLKFKNTIESFSYYTGYKASNCSRWVSKWMWNKLLPFCTFILHTMLCIMKEIKYHILWSEILIYLNNDFIGEKAPSV